MPWIKKNPHLVTLLVVALLVIGGSALVAQNSRSLNEEFEPVKQVPPPPKAAKPMDFALLDQTQQELDVPTAWKSASLPFVPFRYRISKQTQLPEKAGMGKTWPDPLSKELIEDKWFMDNNLPLTDPTVPTQDPDGDGFSNADEWRGKTDPNDKKSFPPFYTKLYLLRYERVRFLLKFNAYDGDPRGPQENLTFQVNTLEYRSPSVFLKIGDDVFNKKFKIVKFEYKMYINKAIDAETEVSELTLENNNTKAPVVLVLNKVIDSPDSYAVFKYLLPNPHQDIRVAKLGKFPLPPNNDQLYELLDITENSASIKAPSGETLKIERLPAGL